MAKGKLPPHIRKRLAAIMARVKAKEKANQRFVKPKPEDTGLHWKYGAANRKGPAKPLSPPDKYSRARYFELKDKSARAKQSKKRKK